MCRTGLNISEDIINTYIKLLTATNLLTIHNKILLKILMKFQLLANYLLPAALAPLCDNI